MSKQTMSNKEIIKRMFKITKPYYGKFAAIVLLSIAAALIRMFMPKVLWQIPDLAINDIKNQNDINLEPISRIVFMFSAMAFISSLLSVFSGLVLAKVIAFFSSDLRNSISKKLNTVSIKFYNKYKTGEILTVMTDDTSAIGETLAYDLSTFLQQSLEVLFAAIMIFTVSWEIGIIAVVFSALILLNAKLFISKIRKTQEKYRAVKGNVAEDLEETFTNHLIIYANAKEDEVYEKLSDKIDKLGEAWMIKTTFKIVSYEVSKSLAARLSRTTVLLYGGFRIIAGKMSFGSLFSAANYFGSMVNPISTLTNIANSFQETLTSAKRIFELLDEEDDQLEDISALTPLEAISGNITFENVNFSYGKKHAIKDFSLDIKAGTKVAIVGPTGSGKTTLVSLLMKFYEPDSGRILLDGIPFDKISRSDIRKSFGMVLQETWLSDGTIMDNLTYGNDQISKADVRNILESAKINHVFESLPKSYDTKIADNHDLLSAGEKQLVTIARVMISDPKMVILDEATSNVDTRTEQLIQDAMNRLTKNRTTFIIAHRLSTILDADIIIVLKDGEIIEKGNHTELLNLHGFYEKLYNSQFEEEFLGETEEAQNV